MTVHARACACTSMRAWWRETSCGSRACGKDVGPEHQVADHAIWTTHCSRHSFSCTQFWSFMTVALISENRATAPLAAHARSALALRLLTCKEHDSDFGRKWHRSAWMRAENEGRNAKISRVVRPARPNAPFHVPHNL